MVRHKLMRAIMVFLDTQAWYSHKTDESFSHQLTEAVSMLVENFRAPLEAKATDLAAIQEEAKEMLDYAHQYLRVDRDGYQHVWYRVAFGPDCTQFRNLVAIAQLLFSLPFSTAKVERLFSSLKLIKTDRRTSLSQETLSDLLEVSVEGTELENFDAVQLWWSDCSRTRHESHPKKIKIECSSETIHQQEDTSAINEATETICEAEQSVSLDDWDSWSQYHNLHRHTTTTCIVTCTSTTCMMSE